MLFFNLLSVKALVKLQNHLNPSNIWYPKGPNCVTKAKNGPLSKKGWVPLSQQNIIPYKISFKEYYLAQVASFTFLNVSIQKFSSQVHMMF